MAENYATNQYSFESRESYEQTKKEAEQIKKLIHSVDLKNPKIALKIYNKCVSDKMFHTMAGYNFLMELRHFIGKSGLVSEQSLAPIPIKEENEKKPDVIAQTSRKEAKWKRLYEGQQLLNKKLKIALFAAVVLLIGFVVINFRFEYSIFTYFTNYKANMEEELIDKYEKWEERLQQKEDSLNQ